MYRISEEMKVPGSVQKKKSSRSTDARKFDGRLNFWIILGHENQHLVV